MRLDSKYQASEYDRGREVELTMKQPAGFVPSYPRLIDCDEIESGEEEIYSVGRDWVWPEHYYSAWLVNNSWWRPMLKGRTPKNT